MITDDNLQNAATSQNQAASPLEIVRVPDWRWVLRWVVLTTVAIPAALLLMAPISAILLSISNLGGDAGLITNYDNGILKPIGFFLGFSLTLATLQWLLLRNYLPRARLWFLATGAGLLIGGMLAGVGAAILSDVEVAPSWGMAMFLLLIGCVVGVAQWLVLRRILPNAFWIVVIDVAGACSLLLAGRSFTNLLELLIIPLLPGVITGVGFWYLLRQSQPEVEREKDVKTLGVTGQRSLPIVWIGLGLVALVPMFFLCIWIYAVSQLALAKNEGIYATVEEAVVIRNSQGWGGAEVVGLENVRASVNQHDGSQPHVWFGGARVYLDRVPQGWDRTEYSSGSYFLRVKEGWVHVPEGAFPEFIGWVMELYGMEGVDEWITENE